MVDDNVCFRREGLTIGDCRTRAGAADDRGAFLLLLSRLPDSGCETADSPSISTSMSTGDVPAELPEVLYWFCW